MKLIVAKLILIGPITKCPNASLNCRLILMAFSYGHYSDSIKMSVQLFYTYLGVPTVLIIPSEATSITFTYGTNEVGRYSLFIANYAMHICVFLH